MGMFDKMFNKEIKIPPTQETVNKAVNDGGITEEKARESMKEEVFARMANWTPKEVEAFNFLKKVWTEKLQIEKLNLEKLKLVEKFAKDPQSVMPSAKYDKATGKFSAEGSLKYIK